LVIRPKDIYFHSLSALSLIAVPPLRSKRTNLPDQTMPQLPAYPGLVADILVDGVPLEELSVPGDVSEDTPASVTRYVEARSGANFEIRVRMGQQFRRDLDPRYDLAISVFVDGVKQKGEIWTRADIAAFGGDCLDRRHKGVKYQADGDWKLKRFMFADFSAGTCNDAVIAVENMH
jgi:hypothetical protein